MSNEQSNASWRPQGLHIAHLALGILRSRDDLPDHVAVDIRESEIAAIVAIGELFVIEAEQVQDGGVQVMNMDLVFHRAIAEFIGGPEGLAAPDATAGQPNAKRPAVMVATRGAS